MIETPIKYNICSILNKNSSISYLSAYLYCEYFHNWYYFEFRIVQCTLKPTLKKIWKIFKRPRMALKSLRCESYGSAGVPNCFPRSFTTADKLARTLAISEIAFVRLMTPTTRISPSGRSFRNWSRLTHVYTREALSGDLVISK